MMEKKIEIAGCTIIAKKIVVLIGDAKIPICDLLSIADGCKCMVFHNEKELASFGGEVDVNAFGRKLYNLVNLKHDLIFDFGNWTRDDDDVLAKRGGGNVAIWRDRRGNVEFAFRCDVKDVKERCVDVSITIGAIRIDPQFGLFVTAGGIEQHFFAFVRSLLSTHGNVKFVFKRVGAKNDKHFLRHIFTMDPNTQVAEHFIFMFTGRVYPMGGQLLTTFGENIDHPERLEALMETEDRVYKDLSHTQTLSFVFKPLEWFSKPIKETTKEERTNTWAAIMEKSKMDNVYENLDEIVVPCKVPTAQQVVVKVTNCYHDRKRGLMVVIGGQNHLPIFNLVKYLEREVHRTLTEWENEVVVRVECGEGGRYFIMFSSGSISPRQLWDGIMRSHIPSVNKQLLDDVVFEIGKENAKVRLAMVDSTHQIVEKSTYNAVIHERARETASHYYAKKETFKVEGYGLLQSTESQLVASLVVLNTVWHEDAFITDSTPWESKPRMFTRLVNNDMVNTIITGDKEVYEYFNTFFQ